MTDFNTWFNELTSDSRFMEFVEMRHKNKPLRDVAEIVYGDYISEGNFPAMGLARRHVHYKLEKVKPVIKNTIQTHQIEEKKEPELPPMKHEDWLKKMDEWKQSLAQVKFIPPPKLSHREIAEEGGWKPKKIEYSIDDGNYYEHINLLHQCQERTVRERHPEWSEEQIQNRLRELRK